jgi:hypothetical protein
MFLVFKSRHSILFIIFSGLLVQTLGSLWFFELTSATTVSSETQTQSREVYYKAHKLAVDALFWSLRFDISTRLFLASTKPVPHARHMVSNAVSFH